MSYSHTIYNFYHMLDKERTNQDKPWQILNLDGTVSNVEPSRGRAIDTKGNPLHRYK